MGRTQSGSSGKGGEGKGGHAIIEPKYLSRFKDFLGDERSWKDWFASLTTAVIQKMNQEKPDCFAALGMLAKRYNPKTPSRILHTMTQVRSPPTVRDVRQAPRMVEEWEAAKGKLKVEFGEELSEVVQIAILTGMLPSDLHDKVNAGAGERPTVYDTSMNTAMSV